MYTAFILPLLTLLTTSASAQSTPYAKQHEDGRTRTEDQIPRIGVVPLEAKDRYTVDFPTLEYDKQIALKFWNGTDTSFNMVPDRNPVLEVAQWLKDQPLEKDLTDPVINSEPDTCKVYLEHRDFDLQVSICLPKLDDLNGWEPNQTVSYQDVARAVYSFAGAAPDKSHEGYTAIKGRLSTLLHYTKYYTYHFGDD
ncbi:MAG: hypothetical protein M1831_006509 [Alyxoria varia]|nr:MAG: hypothetical protein M1831_006509 [Alyxoria varia]